MFLLGVFLSAIALDDKVELGKPVPPFTLKTSDGKEFSLEKARGKTTIFVFWSFKCPTGKSILDGLGKVAARYEEQGVEFFGICSYGETAAELEAYAKEKNLPYPLLVDENCRVANLFDAKVVSSAYILNKDGILVFRGGFTYKETHEVVDPDEGVLNDVPTVFCPVQDAIDNLLAEREVNVKETKAAG